MRPVPVTRVLRKLGHDLRDARRRRRIPVAILAERASISRITLIKVERGDSGVSLGIYATVLFSLGMAGCLADLADAGFTARMNALMNLPSTAGAMESTSIPFPVRNSRASSTL